MLFMNLFTDLENFIPSSNYRNLKFPKNRVFRGRSNRRGSLFFNPSQKTPIVPDKALC